MADQKTNFGFKKVILSEKYSLVKDVFNNVASVYDVMNDLMSLGIHRIWKKQFTELILKSNPTSLLDVGGGTGDIAFRLKKLNPNLNIYVIDINKKMLTKGMERSIDLGYLNKITWVLSNAEALPFREETFDAYSTAFCFRNLTDIKKGLSEAYRVLKKGRKFFCLEFSKVDNKLLNYIYKLWSFKVIPKIGEVVANNKSAYQYLVESIEKFYGPCEFKPLIEEAGFKNVNYKSLHGGIACIHMGEKF